MANFSSPDRPSQWSVGLQSDLMLTFFTERIVHSRPEAHRGRVLMDSRTPPRSRLTPPPSSFSQSRLCIDTSSSKRSPPASTAVATQPRGSRGSRRVEADIFRDGTVLFGRSSVARKERRLSRRRALHVGNDRFEGEFPLA